MTSHNHNGVLQSVTVTGEQIDLTRNILEQVGGDPDIIAKCGEAIVRRELLMQDIPDEDKDLFMKWSAAVSIPSSQFDVLRGGLKSRETELDKDVGFINFLRNREQWREARNKRRPISLMLAELDSIEHPLIPVTDTNALQSQNQSNNLVNG